MAYTAWSVVYGEQPSAAKWNILGTNDAHFYSFLGDNEVWQDWSPSYANITVGNGTVVAKYIQIGKVVHARFRFTLGSTSVVGSSPTVSLPVAANSEYANAVFSVGGIYCDDATSTTAGQVTGDTIISESTTVATPVVRYTDTAAARRVTITATIPFTWTTSDILTMDFSYEAA